MCSFSTTMAMNEPTPLITCTPEGCSCSEFQESAIAVPITVPSSLDSRPLLGKYSFDKGCGLHCFYCAHSMPISLPVQSPKALSLRIFPNTRLLETLKSYRSHRVLCTRSQKKKCLPGAEETVLWRRACTTFQAPKLPAPTE